MVSVSCTCCSSQAADLIPYDNPKHKDNAKEEYEGYGSKAYSVYDNLHKKTSDVFKVSVKFIECIIVLVAFNPPVCLTPGLGT